MSKARYLHENSSGSDRPLAISGTGRRAAESWFSNHQEMNINFHSIPSCVIIQQGAQNRELRRQVRLDKPRTLTKSAIKGEFAGSK